MRTLAILPVKRFGRAKQRLAPDLDPACRRRLAEAMLGDVLEAVAASSVDGAIVVTTEARAAELAAEHGMDVVVDREEAGQSAAARLGLGRAIVEGAQRALLLPGDCPALDAREIDALLGAPAPSPRAVTVVPDRHQTGTNALLLTPPSVLSPSFGPASLERHVCLAEQAGIPCTVTRVPTLCLDVDGADDLEAVRVALADRPGAGRRTRAVLESVAAVAST